MRPTELVHQFYWNSRKVVSEVHKNNIRVLEEDCISYEFPLYSKYSSESVKYTWFENKAYFLVGLNFF